MLLKFLLSAIGMNMNWLCYRDIVLRVKDSMLWSLVMQESHWLVFLQLARYFRQHCHLPCIFDFCFFYCNWLWLSYLSPPMDYVILLFLQLSTDCFFYSIMWHCITDPFVCFSHITHKYRWKWCAVPEWTNCAVVAYFIFFVQNYCYIYIWC